MRRMTNHRVAQRRRQTWPELQEQLPVTAEKKTEQGSEGERK